MSSVYAAYDFFGNKFGKTFGGNAEIDDLCSRFWEISFGERAGSVPKAKKTIILQKSFGEMKNLP